MADVEVNVEEVSSNQHGKMKVTELRKELKDRGLSAIGSKAELLARLEKAINPEAEIQEEADEPDGTVMDELTGDEEMEETEEPVPEPEPEAPKVVVRETAASMTIMESTQDENSKPETKIPSEPTKPIVPIKMESSNPESSTSPVVPIKAPLSAEQKLKQRAERFGIANDTDKKAARAARFGFSNNNSSSAPASNNSNKIAAAPLSGDDLDRLKKRAERFGTISSTLSRIEDEAKRRKRMERFGQSSPTGGTVTSTNSSAITTTTNNNKNNTTTSAAADSTESSKKSSDEVEEKKRKRAERFGLL
ncbi:SAP domain-containing ribonucleoprotein-like [Argonauta hians]